MKSDPRALISLIDLTSLNETDSAETIAAFCQKASTPYGPVAALCIYPPFVKQVAAFCSATSIQVATVANFPQGRSSLAEVLCEIEQSIADGTDEVDVVFPYQAYLSGEQAYAISFIKACKERLGDKVLKVILETGAIKDLTLIEKAAREVLMAGADFVKTSTGKLAGGATPEVAALLLSVVKELSSTLKRPLGLKVAGGVREPRQAMEYLGLARSILGEQAVSVSTFRIGASQLLDKIVGASCG